MKMVFPRKQFAKQTDVSGSEMGCRQHTCFQFSLCSAVRSADPTKSHAAENVASTCIAKKSVDRCLTRRTVVLVIT